jgi:antitoxin component YwqK of YwqJK toxin-antitoxin module
MYKLLPRTSILLAILSCALFSCEQLAEVIIPAKPDTSTCTLIRVEDKDYSYTNGRLTKVSNYGYGDTPQDYPLTLSYDAKGNLIYASSFQGSFIQTHAFTYDENGKLLLKESYTSASDREFTDYAYSPTKTTMRSFTLLQTNKGIDTAFTLTRELYYQNDNLVRMVEKPVGKQPVETLYYYGNTPNKNRKVYTTLGLVEGPSPLESKYLPIRSVRNNASVYSYIWVLNKQGYPVNNGLSNKISNTYNCK